MFQKKYFLFYFLLFQIGFLKICSFYPQFVEQFYSNNFFVILAHTLRLIFGKIPFSVGDVLYAILILFILVSIFKKRKKLKSDWKTNLVSTVNFLSIFYFLFHFLWAFNYYRIPLFEKMHLKKEYSDTDLIHFTEKLISQTNELQIKISKNKNVKVVNRYSINQLFEMTQNGYDTLSKIHPFFRYETPSLKKSLFSLPLSYMGFSGYLNPFTNEAQVNYKVPFYGLPMTICHEMAHQIGYASESECNFIGFLAASKNNNLYFKYAAYTTTLKFCLRSLEIINANKTQEEFKKINKGIIENFKEDKIFWKNYESFIETGFKIFYDNYLKINQQKEGLESYSKFLNLLINYEKTNRVFDS